MRRGELIQTTRRLVASSGGSLREEVVDSHGGLLWNPAIRIMDPVRIACALVPVVEDERLRAVRRYPNPKPRRGRDPLQRRARETLLPVGCAGSGLMVLSFNSMHVSRVSVHCQSRQQASNEIQRIANIEQSTDDINIAKRRLLRGYRADNAGTT
jgi:hypothetical protein